MTLAQRITQGEPLPAGIAPVGAATIAALVASARKRTLTRADVSRIETYVGGGSDLHDILPSVLPLTERRWYETTAIATGGTVFHFGYLLTPQSDTSLQLVWIAATDGAIVGCIGPVVVSTSGVTRLPGMPDGAWREIRNAAGVALRALLFDCGEVH